MRNHLLIILSIFISITALQAQVDKEVEVTRAYIPVVEQATKPPLKASIADTAVITPEVDYDITPLSISTTLKSRAINPAKITYWEFNRPASAQIKVGAGGPLNSLFQGVISTQNSSVGYLAAQLDHLGNYSDIASYSGESRQNATQMLGDASVSAGLYMGKKLLAVDLNYLNNSYRNYAFAQSYDTHILYQGLGANLSFGDDFVDLERLNYGVKASVDSYFDRKMHSSNSLSLNADFAKNYALGDLSYGIGVKLVDEWKNYGIADYQVYGNLAIPLRKVDINVGLNYHLYDSFGAASIESKHYVLPNLMLKYVHSPALIAYAGIDGLLENNGFKELSMINQFVAGGLSSVKPMVQNRGFLGIEGELFNAAFSYSLSADYTSRQNNRYWLLNVANITTEQVYNSFFDVKFGALDIYAANLALAYKPISNLKFSLDATFSSFDEPNDMAGYNSLPSFEGTVGAEYSARVFTLGAKARYIGERSAMMNSYNVGSSAVSGDISSLALPGAIDVSVYADCKLGSRLSIFAQGDNLCNESLYEWAMYRGFGARFTVGVKYNFK